MSHWPDGYRRPLGSIRKARQARQARDARRESIITTPETASTAKLPRPGLTDGHSGEFLVMTKLVPGGADGIRDWHAKRVADPSKEAETRAALREIGTLHDSAGPLDDTLARGAGPCTVAGRTRPALTIGMNGPVGDGLGEHLRALRDEDRY